MSSILQFTVTIFSARLNNSKKKKRAGKRAPYRQYRELLRRKYTTARARASLGPADISTVAVAIASEEKPSSALRAARSRVVVGLRTCGTLVFSRSLCRERPETSGPRALPRGRIRNDAQNSRNWPTRGGQPIVERRRTTPGVLSPSRRPDDAPLLPDRE